MVISEIRYAGWKVRLMGFVIIGVLLCPVSPGGRVPQSEALPGPAGAGMAGTGEDVPADWWSRAQEDIAQREYCVTWQERPCLEGVEASWQAPNRAHGLRTYFTEHGPRVVPRTEREPSWVWGLELIHFTTIPFDSPGSERTPFSSPLSRERISGSPSYQGGAGGGYSVPAVEHIEATANRVEYRRQGGLVEWYVNDSRGLEQGFTIASSPSPLVGEGWGEGE